MAAPAVLRHRREFLAVAQNGKKWAAPGLILQMGAPRKDESLPPVRQEIRYGLTASAKIGGAVVRNRARRRLRALAAEILPLHATPGYDYVLIARASSQRLPFGVLLSDLFAALYKLGAWREQ